MREQVPGDIPPAKSLSPFPLPPKNRNSYILTVAAFPLPWAILYPTDKVSIPQTRSLSHRQGQYPTGKVNPPTIYDR